MKQRRSWWSGSSVPPISRFTFFHVWFDVRLYVSWHCDDAIAVCSRTANYEHDDDDDDDIAFRDSSLVCCVFAAYFDLYDMIATFAVVNLALHFFLLLLQNQSNQVNVRRNGLKSDAFRYQQHWKSTKRYVEWTLSIWTLYSLLRCCTKHERIFELDERC